MADAKISALTDGGGLQPDDEVAINRAGTSFKARGVGTDGWINDKSETWTYASFAAGPPAVGTFTITGDLRAKYTVGTRIKLTQTTVKYFVVSADPTYNSGTNTTTVTVTGGTDYTLANAAISANYHSYAANPQGYPTWFNANPNSQGFSSVSTDLMRFAVTGRTCFVQYLCAGTSNATTYTFSGPIAASAAIVVAICLTRVTDNGSATFTGAFRPTASSATITMAKALNNSGGFTGSGSKGAAGEFFYEI